MTTEAFIIDLFCRVDDQLHDTTNHFQANLYPSQVVGAQHRILLQQVREAGPQRAGLETTLRMAANEPHQHPSRRLNTGKMRIDDTDVESVKTNPKSTLFSI